MRTVIIGGGPAGLTAACFCSSSVCVLERLTHPLRKLLATGGGRCNLTHDAPINTLLDAFGSQARFLAPAIHAFPPAAIRAFFETLGVPTCVMPDGCVFPVSQKAADVVTALEKAARTNGAEIRCGTQATRLVIAAAPNATTLPRVVGVETCDGPIAADRVILACGGQSYPDLGSDGSGFALAQDAGLSVQTPVPALAGLITRETWPATLSGLLVENAGVRLSHKNAAKAWRTGPLLFTHKGISGPPVLDLSGAVAEQLLTLPEVPLKISFRAERTVDAWLSCFNTWRTVHGRRVLHNLLSGELPRTLATTLCELTGARDIPVAHASRTLLRALAEACANLTLQVTHTEPWSRAMVTHGGVTRAELNPTTLRTRRIAGLYCVGELVDVDGPCGGYNLSWAFASGHLAAQAASQPD